MGALRLLAALALALSVAGCGEDTTSTPPSGQSSAEFQRALDKAGSPRAADFPHPRGKTLQQVADRVKAGPQIGLATSVFTQGRSRIAFGLLDSKRRFVYGRTAVYVAPGPRSPARGPYLAPASPLVVEPRFRSRGAAEEAAPLAAIYAAQAPFTRAGKWSVLTVTRLKDGLFGAPSQVKVRSSSIPAVGERAPRVSTETLASASGNMESIDTRVPPAPELHRTDFKDVIGRKPVALLFATPALCESRVCGPVTDIALQLRAEFGDRVEFIHQEVFVDNEMRKGLRPPLRAFRLRTEPWLFTFDRRGRVAARLEGSFGIPEFRRAVKDALRR
ncbi:MAG: hypothetical protein M3375_07500 [Actinomycetota bacterium]|nr:hypothetical protein [Actinomycetota bacterium]